MNIWAVFLGIGTGLELFAIITKEKYYPTLSRSLWRAFGFEDKSFDRVEMFWRIVVTLIFSVVCVWAVIHIAWGPCALGVC
jgi:hypothetical protein